MSVTGSVDQHIVNFLQRERAAVMWDIKDDNSGGSLPAVGDSGRLRISCLVLTKEDVSSPARGNERGLLLNVWMDVDLPENMTETEIHSGHLEEFLVLAQLTSRTIVAILARSSGDNVYRRHGLAELKKIDRWGLRSRQEIILE